MLADDKRVDGVLLPRAVDERTRQEKVTLSQIRQVIPKQYMRPNPLRSWWALARVLSCVALCLWLLLLLPFNYGIALLWEIPALIALWTLYGWILVGLFVIGHDCGHKSFSRKAWVNALVGYLCMSPLANSFHSWRLTHDHHHVYTQLRGQEVDWAVHLVTREEYKSATSKQSFITRLGYALPFGIFLWIAWNTARRGVTVHTVVMPKQLAGERRKLLWSNLITGTYLLALYGTLWYFSGFWGMLKYYGVPATIAMVTSWLIITLQHANEHSLLYEKAGWTPVRGQLVSTFDVRFPAWLEYLWCHINIHIPHHICPIVPWYYLKKVGGIIRRSYPALYQEQVFCLRHLSWFYRTPFLKQFEDKGYYLFEARTTSRS